MSIKKHNIYLFFTIPFIGFLMNLVKDTNADRYAYLWHFAHPFDNTRIEILFQYYMYIYKLLYIPPEISIIITILIIYILFVKIWFQNIKWKNIESFLVINGIIFSIFNYYLGTSIRMGFAMSLVLWLYYKIENNQYKKNIKYYFLMIACIFLHYGTILFVSIYLFKKFINFKSIKKEYLILFIGTIILLISIKSIFYLLPLNSYYQQYLSGFGNTGRIIPFTILIYILLILLLILKKNKTFSQNLILYGIPFIVIQLTFKWAFIGKMLMPFIFLALVEIYNIYYTNAIKYLESKIRFMILVVFNIVSILYALKMYNYI